MTYITVYNLSINSNYRILAAELNYRFTEVCFSDCHIRVSPHPKTPISYAYPNLIVVSYEPIASRRKLLASILNREFSDKCYGSSSFPVARIVYEL